MDVRTDPDGDLNLRRPLTCPWEDEFSVTPEDPSASPSLGSYGCVGAQGGPTQNMPQRHIDYLEMKSLEKQPMQEGKLTFLCPSESRISISHVKGALAASGSRRTPFLSETGKIHGEADTDKRGYFLN